MNFRQDDSDVNYVTTNTRNIFRIEIVGVETEFIVLPQRNINCIVTPRIRKAASSQNSKLYTSVVNDGLAYSDDDESEKEAANNDFTCYKCSRAFTSEERLSHHKEYFKEQPPQTPKTFLARAVRLCQALMQSNDIDVQSVTEDVIVQDIDVTGAFVAAVSTGL